ncbi:MAG TPA: potassium channel family protein [Rubrivivax sp.]|jgi:voltage-gated potassium channel|nr:potassium channel family protein [Rubrivivax sp.]
MNRPASTNPLRAPEQAGLSSVFASQTTARARAVEVKWRWPITLALLSTVPSFYVELLHESAPLFAVLSYLVAAATMAGALLHVGLRSGHLAAHLRANGFDLVLCAGLVTSALLPPSSASEPALWFRLVVGFFTMSRMFWAAHYVVTRGGTLYRLIAALLVLMLCGLGFWWLEPTTPTFGEALWLAFTTAATVGYGDLVPTTPASRIFAVGVVFLGVGAITLVAAGIASAWIATEERTIEREILADLHKQLGALREELAALRETLPAASATSAAGSPGAAPGHDPGHPEPPP